MINSREQEIEIMEANMAHDSNAYFTARHEMLDTRERRVLFDSAYKRAWQACQELNDNRIAELEAKLKDATSDSLVCPACGIEAHSGSFFSVRKELEARLKVASEALEDSIQGMAVLAATMALGGDIVPTERHIKIVIEASTADSTLGKALGALKQLTE